MDRLGALGALGRRGKGVLLGRGIMNWRRGGVGQRRAEGRVEREINAWSTGTKRRR